MRPTLPEAFRRTIERGRNLGPRGMPVTMERITQVIGNGHVEVLGMRIPVTGLGGRALRAGSRVAVAWQQGRPIVAIAHSARRSGAPVPLPALAGGIVEELFIAGPEGERDVYFRNDQQVTKLELRAGLPGDPVDVRLGADTRSFVVRVGGPAGAIDFTGEVENPPQDQTYHVFELDEAKEGEILGEQEAAATLLASYAPSESALEVLAFNGEYASSLFNRHVKTLLTTDEIDPPPIGEIDPIPQCVPTSFGVVDQADSSLHASGTVDRTAKTLGDLLLTQTEGPAAIIDFGLDKNRHLLLVVRARKSVVAQVPTTTTGNVKDANASSCDWDDLPTPDPTTQPVVSLAGEAHGWVVDLTAGVLKFRTNDVEADLKDTEGETLADVVGIEGVVQVVGSSGCSSSCGAGTHALVSPPDNPNPSVFYPTGAALAYGTLPAPSITPQQWKDLWDEARFAFISGSLKRTGTVVNVAKSAAIFTGMAILGYAEPYNPFDVESQLITWSAPTPSYDAAPPVYHVLDLRLLRTQMDLTYPMLLFLSMMRRLDDGTHQDSAYIIREDGSIVRTLRDWMNMGAGAVMSEIRPFETHSGMRAALIGGNFDHVLWEFSTEAERAAGTRQIRLTQLSIGATVEVGSAWAEFAGHDFRVLNLDVLYSAKEDDETGKRFIVGWDPETGQPSLSQAQADPKYPVEDDDLESVQGLADLDPDTPAPSARELQAINDIEALAQAGRELEPEVV